MGLALIMSKTSKRRDCPALARIITSAECGSGRHISISCPPECGFNPFSLPAYAQLRDVEDRLDKRTVDALIEEIGIEAFERILRGSPSSGNETDTNTTIVRELFFRRDAGGRSFAERWQDTGKTGLKTDEQVMLAGKARMRPALLEIQEVRPDGSFTAVDLLEPTAGLLIFKDRMTWDRALRHEVMLVWTYPLPHYWRLSGGGIRWPDWPELDLSEVEQLHEIMHHAGNVAADAPLPDKRDWLAFHFEEVQKAVFAVSDARRRDMLESIDAQWGWSEYRLDAKTVKALRRKLTNRKAPVRAVEPDEDDREAGFDAVWDWLALPKEKSDEHAHPVMGNLLLAPGKLRVRAMGSARLASLRTEVLEFLGQPNLSPEREFVENIGQQEASKIDLGDLALVPPRLREQPGRIELQSYALDSDGTDEGDAQSAESYLGQMARRWLDSALPALAGRTPREAVAEPSGRTKVLRLVKGMIRREDRDCLQGRLKTRSTGDLVHALGLAELDLPPPPDRPCPEEFIEEEIEPDQIETTAQETAPEWLGRVLHKQEVFDRLDRLEQVFPTDKALVRAWERSCPALANLLAQETSFLTPASGGAIDFVMATTWAVLGGAAVPGKLQLDTNRVRLRLEEGQQRLPLAAVAPPAEDPLLGMCTSQPEVALGIIAELFHRLKQAKQPMTTRQESFMLSVLWMHASIPEVESALSRASPNRR